MQSNKHRAKCFMSHIVAYLALVLFAGLSSAEELVVSEHAVVNTGRHIYMRNCAVCHGNDAAGGGPYAPMLVAAPADLTILSRHNGGQFPLDRVREVISGNELMPAHGSRDMPIWGQRFVEEANTLGVPPKKLVRSRILELIAYLEHVQQE